MKYVTEISNVLLMVLLLVSIISDFKTYRKMSHLIKLDKAYLDCYKEYVEINSKILKELSK